MSAPPRSTPPPPGRLVIDLSDLPVEGREVTGQIEGDVFQLEPDGPRVASPLRYRLHVERQGDLLVASGNVEADFIFDCVLCLEPFTDRIALEDYRLEEELDGKTATVDLTDRLREDILLALPGHPRCNEAALAARTCPAAELFPPASHYAAGLPENKHPSLESRPVWGALDQLDLTIPAAPKAAKKARPNR